MHKRPGSIAAAIGPVLFGVVALAAAPAGAQERAQAHDLPRFAESARAVVNGAYVDNFQIATVRANEQDHYLTDQPYGANDPEFSPNGSRIYYWAATDTMDVISWVPSEGGPSTPLDTGCGANPDCLGDDTPAISPNGRHLLTMRAFLPIDDNGNATNVSIFRMKIDGSDAVQVTFPEAGINEDHAPRWSPDGRHIAFQRLTFSTGSSTVFVADSDGSNVHAVTAPGLDSGDPDWSPDGKWIAFQSPAEPDAENPQQIYRIRADGTHLVQLTSYAADPNLTIKTYRPRWSPDGKKIAFTHVDPSTTQGPDGVPHGDIFIMKPDGSDVVQATHTPDAENGATWDPRGCRAHAGSDAD